MPLMLLNLFCLFYTEADQELQETCTSQSGWDGAEIPKGKIKGLARILKLPVVFERVPLQNGVKWSKMG